MKKIAFSCCLIVALAACETSTGGFTSDLPEVVVELAAPNQNLAEVTRLEEDGCYWYRYSGPVETTLLPLLTREGRHICTRPQS